eukprot:SAG11_NODE_1393_length_5047_cov_14.071140_1_plen_73_part_00
MESQARIKFSNGPGTDRWGTHKIRYPGTIVPGYRIHVFLADPAYGDTAGENIVYQLQRGGQLVQKRGSSTDR